MVAVLVGRHLLCRGTMNFDWRAKISRAVETTGFAVACAFAASGAARPIIASQSNLLIDISSVLLRTQPSLWAVRASVNPRVIQIPAPLGRSRQRLEIGLAV